MPNWKKLITSGSDALLNTVQAVSFTGSLFGTASYAVQALSASYAPGGATFPFTGSAGISGSLIVDGPITSSRDLLVNRITIGTGPGNISGNTVVGEEAGLSLNGADYDTAVGYQAMYSNTNGYNNTAVGTFAMYFNATGAYNTTIGWGAGNYITEDFNVGIGSKTFNNNPGGSYRVAVGYESQYQGSGNNNTSIGHQTLRSLTTGTGNIAIGYQAGYNETTSNKLYIANSSTTTPLIGGDFANTRLGININPGSTTSTLHVKGSGTTSSTTALLIQNANASASLTVLDNAVVSIGSGYAKTITLSPEFGGTRSRIQGGYGNGYVEFGGVGYGNISKIADNEIQVASDAYPQSLSIGPAGTNQNIGVYNYSIKSGSVTYFFVSSSGNVGIGTTTPSYRVDVSGSVRLSGNTLITGSLTVGLTTTGSSENTLTLGPSPAGGTGEGGQLGLNAAGGSYTSASFIDTWQDQFRILRGSNASSNAGLMYMDLQTGNTNFVGAVTASAYSGLPNAWLHALRTSNQTIGSGTWASRDIIFDQVSSVNFTYNSSTGIATLKAGKVYRVTARIAWAAAGLYTLKFRVYNQTTSAYTGPTVEMIQSPNGTYNVSDNTLEHMMFVGASDIDISIRTTSDTNALTGEYVRGDLNTQLIIQQIA